MYERIRAQSADLTLAGPILSISHSKHLLPLLGLTGKLDITEANYPEVNILSLPYPDNSFGVLVSDQVFEHIDGLPEQAMRETLRVLAPGGWLLHTTCFRAAYHGPGDYWRFTAEGLERLAILSGASEARGGQHGHPAEIIVNLLGWNWAGVPKAKWHPFRWLAALNRHSYGNTVWVFARK
jgi:SAM-dependent methyltransferase